MTDDQCDALILAIRNLTKVHADAMADLTTTLEQGFAAIASNLTGDPDAVPLAIGDGFDRLDERLETSLGYISGAIHNIR
jgi:hypothetical protein